MQRLLGLMAAAALAATAASSAPPAPPPPFALERVIPLPGVTGRIDHLAFDPRRGRLWVAELGAGSAEEIDLAAGRLVGRIGGLAEPQGIGVAADLVAIASGGDGTVRFYRADDLSPAGELRLGDDADDVRVTPDGRQVVVGYGSGALAVIDPGSRRLTARVALPAHPEGFALFDHRAAVNLPQAGQVDLVDLAAGRVLDRWKNAGAAFNFPLSIDPARAEAAVAYRLPARLVILDLASGAVRQRLPTCGDADDLFHDPARRRIYVVCGAGRVDVFERRGEAYVALPPVATRPGARTGLFLPQLDRLVVAARAAPGRPAAILVLKPQAYGPGDPRA